ncbi:aggrecan core protein-like [Mercenaria mercenaria]|uniref:aggrecan core protein-like n=1 Tax=Mercenaria mercenaria TaxID=6596 RepID=UPI00234E94F6|nr:aggrecan core protein-like [Mercenaria mercenaria]XP_053380408.1 aggrecan core protein-like [Mercenaria mercenaria]XP_053380409.1 aggrecan core protein-like [Mercenaria mercenaria]
MFLNESVLAFFILLINTLHEAEASGQALVFFNPSSAKTETISENASPGQTVFVVIATDSEGNTLTYSIRNQTPSTPSFPFDSSTGELTSPSGLDAETTTSFTFEFSVTDGTSTVTSPILTVDILDVNESPPVFNQTSYTATIYDTVTNGTLALTVFALDPDVTASLIYSITVGDTTTFSIGASSGDITVTTTSNLDPSTTPSYRLTVQVSDGSFTDTVYVTITVIDDPCSPNPCQNSSTCSQSGSSYICACQPGWIDSNCSTGISMCPKEVEQREQSQYLFQLGEKCYEFVPLEDSWMYAKEDCHNKSGHLLSIISADEQTFISNMLTTINFTQQLWLGLDDRITEEQWELDTGDPVHYINWIPGRYIDQYHDQEDCAVMDMSRGGQWDDVDCNTVVSGGMLSYPWICQYDRQRPASNSTAAVITAGSWSSWFYGSCSVSCGTGTTHRMRTCSTGNLVDCTGKDFETVSCNTGPCPASWSSWFHGTCSVTCGSGTSGKLRRCSTGKEADCPGKAFEILSCDEGPCPTDGSWRSWQVWSTCSTTCGVGRRFRTRICNNPAPQNNGLDCSGSINETSTCNHGDCPR